MALSLWAEPVRSVLDELHALAAIEDPLADARRDARSAELGRPLTTPERWEVYGDAPPRGISRAEGELLYFVCRAVRPELVVEFGASHGISTIYLGAAVLDNGSGRMITTEIRPVKAEATGERLRRAGLDEVVDLRFGDARETLRDLPASIGFLFLDGPNDLYLEVLQALEPKLALGAVVVGDLTPDDPDLVGYVEYVRNTAPFHRIEFADAPDLEASIFTP